MRPYLISLLIVFCGSCTKPTVTVITKQGLPLTAQTNIVYASNLDTGSKKVILTLDLYFPPGATTISKYPLVLMIHGGTFLFGDKSDVNNDSRILADSGFVVAAINYRLGWKIGIGTCGGDTSSLRQAGYRALQDANAAFRYLVAHSNDYAIDSRWLFAGGSSAGSITALSTSYITENIAKEIFSAEHAQLGPVNNAGNDYPDDFQIRGICNMWGALPDSTLITVHNALPTISFHGTKDNTVPYDIGRNYNCNNYLKLYGSACIQRRLTYFGVPAVSNFVIGAGHWPSAYTDEFLMSNTACFFKSIMKSAPLETKVYTSLQDICVQ